MEDLSAWQRALVPVMSRQRFAELAGVEDGVVRGWIERGQIPTVKVGRHRLINIALLHDECMCAGGETTAPFTRRSPVPGASYTAPAGNAPAAGRATGEGAARRPVPGL